MNDVRLIDANAVVTIQVFDEMTEEYSMETITVAKAIDRWSDEGCPPTIDAVPVVHAENVTPTHSTDMFVCGNCGFTCEITKLIYEDEDHPEVGIPIAFEYDCKYCPDCGAKMEGVEG